MHIGEHKTSRAHGAIKLELGPEITAALETFMPHSAHQAWVLVKHAEDGEPSAALRHVAADPEHYKGSAGKKYWGSTYSGFKSDWGLRGNRCSRSPARRDGAQRLDAKKYISRT